jgi:hypothetical protein
VINWRFLIILLVLFSSYSLGQSAEKDHVSFGCPFFLGGPQRANPKEWTGNYCLADEYESGLNAVLLDSTGMCVAKTGATFPYGHPWIGPYIQANRLVGAEKCFKMRNRSPRHFRIAVVGVEPSKVRLIPATECKLPLPADVLAAAREMLKHPVLDSSKPYAIVGKELSRMAYNPITDSPAKVMRADDATLLVFGFPKDSSPGPLIVYMNNNVFRLEGWCTIEHIFFSVSDRLHLAYGAPSCNSGEYVVYVYDLSGRVPKQVYVNGALGT